MLELLLFACGMLTGLFGGVIGLAVLVRSLTVPICQAITQATNPVSAALNLDRALATADTQNAGADGIAAGLGIDQAFQASLDGPLRVENALQPDPDPLTPHPYLEKPVWLKPRKKPENGDFSPKPPKPCEFCAKVRRAIFGPKGSRDVEASTFPAPTPDAKNSGEN